MMCEYCNKPNKTIVEHISGVSAFVGAGRLWLRFYDKERNKTFSNFTIINYCPMCGRKLTEGVMEENTNKFEIKIDPLDFYPGLKDKMAEFESLIRIENPGKKPAEKTEKDLKSRFCHCCFFGRVEGELLGEPLCRECAKILYGFDADEEHPSVKKIDPYYQLWYRRQRALPVFEAFLHAEVERYNLEQKLTERNSHD